METLDNMFTPKKRESAVDIVINSIKDLLIENKLVSGARLPCETDLATNLGVSRGSVREAIKILSAFGVVNVKVGDGTYIASDTKNKIADPILFSLLLSTPNISELTEFRKFLEIDLIEMILLHTDKNQQTIEKLERNVDKLRDMKGSNQSIDRFTENDIEFHRLLAEASCNILMEKVYNFVLDYLEPMIAKTQLKQELGSISYQVHKNIFDAIKTNDLKRAIDAINYSVEVWEDLIK